MGLQGHAGTVPMAMRRDAMVAAAGAIVAIEHICKHPEEFLTNDLEQTERHHFVNEGALVCTVGEIGAWPGASNVIPGEVIQAPTQTPLDCFQIGIYIHAWCYGSDSFFLPYRLSSLWTLEPRMMMFEPKPFMPYAAESKQ